MELDYVISQIEAVYPIFGTRWLCCEGDTKLLFTNNETNYWQLSNAGDCFPYVKDGVNDYIVYGLKFELTTHHRV